MGALGGRVCVVEGVTRCCQGVSQEVSGVCGGGVSCEVLGVQGVRGVTRCRGVSRKVSVTGEVSAPMDGSRGGVSGGVDGLWAMELQGGSQWRGTTACPCE